MSGSKFTVVVIGFYGSTARNVDRYAQTWRNRVSPAQVARVVTNDCSGTLSMLSMGAYTDARRIVDEIKDDKQVIFHILSNRGMFVYISAVRMLPKSVKVLGTVFDSCPGSLSPILFFKATAANEKNERLKRLHELAPYLIISAFAYQYGIVRTLLTILFVEVNQRAWTGLYHYHVANRDPARCPALFLYSEEDKLVSYKCVEAVADSREKAIGRVYRKKWADSPHVKHLQVHEDEYVDQLKQFVDNIVPSAE